MLAKLKHKKICQVQKNKKYKSNAFNIDEKF